MSEPSPEWLTRLSIQSEEASAAMSSPLSRTKRYYDNATQLRIDFMREFYRHDTLRADLPWLLYGPQPGNYSDTLGASENTLQFLWLARNINKRPCIRFTTAELVFVEEETERFIACDFTLDYDNDAVVTWNMFEKFQDDFIRYVPPTEVLDGGIAGNMAMGIKFAFNRDGALTFDRMTPATVPIVAGYRARTPEDKIIPFGTHSSIADMTHALHVGRQLLAGVQGMSPMAVTE